MKTKPFYNELIGVAAGGSLGLAKYILRRVIAGAPCKKTNGFGVHPRNHSVGVVPLPKASKLNEKSTPGYGDAYKKAPLLRSAS